MNRSGIYIALATFDGESYLQEQIRSIQTQSLTDWTLLVSDDGSNDHTLDIVRQLISEDPRIELLPPRDGQAGHVANFEYILATVQRRGGEYVFLADQDDVWEPEKLETLLVKVGHAQGKLAAVFSDLWMMDSGGKRFGGFLASHRLEGRYDTASILRTNFAVGCSMLLTADLFRVALPFPPGLENHDWWLGLCAAALGQLGFSPEKLVNYRQHADNAIGGKNYYKQLFKLGSIIHRQRRVFESKITAVDELVRRLQVEGRKPPEALLAWQNQFSQAVRWQKPRQLLLSEFKPKSRALLLIQLLAVSPLARSKIEKAF